MLTGSIVVLALIGNRDAAVAADAVVNQWGHAAIREQVLASEAEHPGGDISQIAMLPGWRERIQEVSEPRPFGAAGSKRIQYSGGFGIEVNDTDPMVQGGVSWSHFFAENLSLDLELNGLYFNQDVGDDALGINANLILRWHFYTADSWSLYGDGGAGLMATTAHVPSVGSSINFTPQIGGGVSFDLSDNRRLLTGVRWHHISNGETFDDNDGRDSAYFYATISIPY